MNGATLSNLLHRGAQRMRGELPPPPGNLFDSGACGASGACGTVDIDISHAKKLVLLVDDVDSYDPSRVIAGWANPELIGPEGATPLDGARAVLSIRGRKPAEGIVMKLDTQAVFETGGKGFTRFRAVAGVDQQSGRSDINPKVRFYVFDQEPDRQQLVRVSGDPPVPFAPWRYSPDQLVARLYEYALERAPSSKELGVARRMADSAAGLEDLLWSVFLLPEFQYIR